MLPALPLRAPSQRRFLVRSTCNASNITTTTSLCLHGVLRMFETLKELNPSVIIVFPLELTFKYPFSISRISKTGARHASAVRIYTSPPQIYIRDPLRLSLLILFDISPLFPQHSSFIYMNLARLFAPTALAPPVVDVIALRASKPSILSNRTQTTFRSMSKTTALGKGYEGNGEKGKKAPAIPRPSSR